MIADRPTNRAVDLPVASCAPSAIRTRDLLLRRHSPDLARCGWMWPDVALSCTDSGWMWPGDARYLPPLAPHLAPPRSRWPRSCSNHRTSSRTPLRVGPALVMIAKLPQLAVAVVFPRNGTRWCPGQQAAIFHQHRSVTGPGRLLPVAAARWVSWAPVAGDVAWPDGGHQGAFLLGGEELLRAAARWAGPAIVSGQHAAFPDILITGAMPGFHFGGPRERGGVRRAGTCPVAPFGAIAGIFSWPVCQRERMGCAPGCPQIAALRSLAALDSRHRQL
jgi:hypothetical protein